MTDSTEEEEFAELSARVRQLPREIDPPGDAWERIKAEMSVASPVSSIDLKSSRSGFWHRPALLAAAGLVLVAASSLTTAAVMGWHEGTRPAAVASEAGSAAPSASGPETLAEFASVENDYISTANELSAVLESEKTTLSPETVAKLRQSLRIIDGAIVEARRALAADPANRALIDMLDTSYNQKLDLLRRTTEMGRS